MVNPQTWFVWVLSMGSIPFALLAAWRYTGRLYGGL